MSSNGLSDALKAEQKRVLGISFLAEEMAELLI